MKNLKINNTMLQRKREKCRKRYGERRVEQYIEKGERERER